MLSGYVLASQILFCVAEAKPKAFIIFLVRRWMRTVPAYVVALVVISVLFGELGSSDFCMYLGYVQNLFRQSTQTDYFSVAWSLSVEEWFYVGFPSLLLAAAALTGQRNIKSALAVAVTFLAAVALARFWFGDFSDWGAEVRRVVIYRIDSIAYGFLLYLLVQHLVPAYFARLSFPAVTAFLVTSTILVFWASAAISKHDSFLAKQLFPWLAALFGSGCILLALKMERAVASRGWLADICLFGGRISYSVYLFHMIFLIVLGSIQLAQPTIFRFVAYVAIVALFAALFYWSFEKPLLLARPRLAVAMRSARSLG